ncbi:hypothetical protein Tco_1138301, partial [Tanacetum coccineum]
MNRSFRAPEKEMPIHRNLKEKEEELGLFLEMKKREKERLSGDFHSSFDCRIPSLPQERLLLERPFTYDDIASRNGNSNMVRKTGAEEFLNSENDKNDYDWNVGFVRIKKGYIFRLMTPPGTPLFPSLEMESQKTVMNQNGTSKAPISSLKSGLSNNQPEANGRNNLVSRPRAASPALGAGQRRQSGGSGSKPSTPTGSRPAL